MMDSLVPVEDVLSRKEQKREPLYAGRVKVHPKDVRGTVRRIKWILLALCLGAYYLGPWIRWDRGPGIPDQALLVDLPNRRFYFFWIEIWPQEIYYLTALMSLGKFRKRLTKHAVWLLIALLTGGAWIMYFYDAPTLVVEFFTGAAPTAVYFFVGLFTATTYLLGGIAREQVCVYMCPWPRFQSALLDEDSLIVTYERGRGEPRAHHKKGDSWEGRGHCIDDRQCVAVCPTGIDIRDGLQMQCIGCGLCIDACDSVMDKVGLPRGLVRFDSERNQQRIAAGMAPERWTKRLVRARTIIYGVLILTVLSILLAGLGGRSGLDITVQRERNPLYVPLSDGSIRNGFTVKILNQTREPHSYALAIEGVDGALVSVVGQEGAAEDTVRLTADASSVTTYRVHVALPRSELDGETTALDFLLTDLDRDVTVRYDTTFRGP